MPHQPPITIVKRLAPSFDAMHLQIQPMTPPPGAQVVYVVKDVFTTYDGQWDVGVKPPPYGIEEWARSAYLKPFNAPDYFDDAGGATHLFAAVIGLDGQLIRNHTIRFWTKDNQNHFEVKTKEKSGWANHAGMNKDSGFVPDHGETGAWCWAPDGAIESVIGGGLPNRWHVSTFVVWQAVRVG
jgi:hypothetical protein